MTRLNVLLVGFASMLLTAFLNSWTDDAYTQDPAECALHASACDADIAAALASFPYWDYRAKAEGGGTHFLLGTSNGYLWGLTCQHCGKRVGTWEFEDGPHAGRVFDAIDYKGETRSGAYRQFGNGNAAPLGSRHYGDLLFRFAPQQGESLPDVPFVRLLPGKEKLKDGTLMLSIGNGRTGTHPTLGWFTECSTYTEGGAPPGGRDPCCTDERWAGNYGPSGSNPHLSASSACLYPFANNPSHRTHPALPACWGGEGDFAACRQAGLTYLGPVWDSSNTAKWHWATWEFRVSYFKLDTSFSSYSYLRIGRTEVGSVPGESALGLGHCMDLPSPGITGVFTPRSPPTNRVNSHLGCHTAIQGDSGSIDFAYIDGFWFLIGSGGGPGGAPLHSIPEENRSDWESWVFGTTDGVEGDEDP